MPRTASQRSRAPAPRLADAVAVAVGGALGSLARHGVDRLVPPADSAWAWSTQVVNVTGSFALALLLGVVGASSGAGRRVRLLLGTGLLGGYTTFSGLVRDADTLAAAERPVAATAYVVAGTLAMLLAATLGWLVARRARPTGGAA